MEASRRFRQHRRSKIRNRKRKTRFGHLSRLRGRRAARILKMSKKANRNILKHRLAPGIWIDANNDPHISVAELLEFAELPDTPVNRSAVTALALKTLRENMPDAKIIQRETPEE